MSALLAQSELFDRQLSRITHSYSKLQNLRTPPCVSAQTPSAPRKPVRRRVRRLNLQPRCLTYDEYQQEPVSQQNINTNSRVDVASQLQGSLGKLTLSVGDADKENRPDDLVCQGNVLKNKTRRIRLKSSSWFSPPPPPARHTDPSTSSSASSGLPKLAFRSLRL